VIIGGMSSPHFAPMEAARQNLFCARIHGIMLVVGNAVTDVMHRVAELAFDWITSQVRVLPVDSQDMWELVAARRRENLDSPLGNIRNR